MLISINIDSPLWGAEFNAHQAHFTQGYETSDQTWAAGTGARGSSIPVVMRVVHFHSVSSELALGNIFFDVSSLKFQKQFFTLPLSGHSGDMRNALEEIALIEMYAIWSSTKPFPNELLKGDEEEIVEKGKHDVALKGTLPYHAAFTAF